MDKRRTKRGFTLVELIVVLVILALLAALLVPALTGYIDKARKRQVIAETRMLHTAIQTEMSELYAKPEWQGYVPTIDGREIIAGKNAADANKANRYNDIVDLSELSSLTADGKGAFGAYVTDTGKVSLRSFFVGDSKNIYDRSFCLVLEFMTVLRFSVPHRSYKLWHSPW